MPQVAVTVTTAEDDRSATVEHSTHGVASVTLATRRTKLVITLNYEGEFDIRVQRQDEQDTTRREVVDVFADPEESTEQSVRVRWHEARTISRSDEEGGYRTVRLRNRATFNR